MHFTHIAALYSELVAVSSGGHLCQWRWNDVEPYANLEVRHEQHHCISGNVTCLIDGEYFHRKSHISWVSLNITAFGFRTPSRFSAFHLKCLVFAYFALIVHHSYVCRRVHLQT